MRAVLASAGMQISRLALINLSARDSSDSGSTQQARGCPSSQPPLGGTGGNAGGLSAVPNFYFATDLAKDLKIGVGISVPFGLKTEYDADWMGRFQAIKSDIATFNVNPSVAYKVSEDVSLGFGLSYQQINAELSNAVNFAAEPTVRRGATWPRPTPWRRPAGKARLPSRAAIARGI